MFREKALLVAEKLLPAFDTPTGIPLGIINVETGVIPYTSRPYSTTSVHCYFVRFFLTFTFHFFRQAEILCKQAKVPVFFQSSVH